MSTHQALNQGREAQLKEMELRLLILIHPDNKSLKYSQQLRNL